MSLTGEPLVWVLNAEKTHHERQDRVKHFHSGANADLARTICGCCQIITNGPDQSLAEIELVNHCRTIK